MLSAFINSLKIPALKQRIVFTLGLIFVARIGANIPLPGLDSTPLQTFFAERTAQSGSSLLGLYNMFTGGALLNGAVCALGIMPYISASIIMQLMTAVFPGLARLQQEGEIGRQKLVQYGRYLTVLICFIQGLLLLLALAKAPGKLFPGFDIQEYGPIVIIDHVWFLFNSTIFLTAGTTLLMWLGEQITQRGIGNGVSLLITIGILSDLPAAFITLVNLFTAPVGETARLTLPEDVLMLFLLFLTTAGIVAVTQAQRKISVHYAKRVVGRKIYGGQTSFIPLKVNYSGVMPVIFASALLMFPQQIFSQLGAITGLRFLSDFAALLTYGSWFYYTTYSLLILAFSYFWVSIMFKPIQIAEDLKKNGGYIPGVRPGEPTAKFLDFVMTRLTLAGAIFLTIIAVFPAIVTTLYRIIPYQVTIFFGGTGMLITVGVLLDTMRQVETYLLQRHYDGFLKKGRIRGRSTKRVQPLLDTAEIKQLGFKFWAPVFLLLFTGIIAWILREF